jgi:hypothetical protein
MSVSSGPGAIALTRMPGPSSIAAIWVSISNPALAIE